MDHRKPHNGARFLRYYLKKQLQFLRKGLIDEAQSLSPFIEKTVSEISKERIDDEISLKILNECRKMNDEILIRFEAEKNGIARNLFQTEVERKIREFLD